MNVLLKYLCRDAGNYKQWGDKLYLCRASKKG